MADSNKEIRIDSEVYSKASLSATIYYLSDIGQFELSKEEDDFVVEVEPSDDNSLEEVKERFMEDLNKYEGYFTHQKKNKEKIENVITKALFTSSPVIFDETQEKEVDDLIDELEEDDELQELTSTLNED